MKTLTVISPVYNEEDVIESFYKRLSLQLGRLSESYESKILFVVDRSPDGTLDILKKVAENDGSVQILALSSRFGHQMSLLAGIDHADADIVIMMDCDLQHPPELIPRMLAEYEKGFDIVYTIRKDTSDISIFKRYSSKLFYRAVNMISDVPFSDSAPDFRLLSKRVVRVIKEKIRERNLFLRGMINWIGFSKTSLPFMVEPRAAGQSKYSLPRMFRFAMAGMMAFSKKPLQAASFVGAAFAVVGFLYAAVVVARYFFDHSRPQGWTTVVILLIIFSGIQLIFLGVIGEYIGGIFEEVKARPHYIVEEKINFFEPTSERIPHSLQRS